LAAPLWAASHSPKIVQLLSLALSILTLLLFYRLLYKEEIIQGEDARYISFLLICFLPSLILSQIVIDNDTLAIFLGALATLYIFRVLKHSTVRQILLLGLAAAAGLLTKANFLPLLPVLGAIVFWALQRSRTAMRSAAWAGVFLLAVCTLGSEKFIQNYLEAGNPFASALDGTYSWIPGQEQTYRGLASFVDINLFKVVLYPTTIEKTDGSYPLLLYETTWYPYPNRRLPYAILGSVTNLLAIIPTIFFFRGIGRLTTIDPGDHQWRLAGISASLAFLLGSIGLLVAVIAKYHVWSVMSARLFYPSLSGFIFPFALGTKNASKWSWTALHILAGCFLVLLAGMALYRVLFVFYPGSLEILKRMT